MTLTLTLENIDRLESGGPVALALDGRELHVGRRNAMDWVLPDASKLISGHHFTLRPDQGQYWLIDMSTNGTYLQGQSHRLQAPHPLRAGDRFLVGHYVISVSDGAAMAHPAQGGGQVAAPQTGGEDPWDFGFAPAVQPLPARGQGSGADIDQSLGGFVPMPQGAAMQPAPEYPAHSAPAQPSHMQSSHMQAAPWPAQAAAPPEGDARAPIPPLSPPGFAAQAGFQAGYHNGYQDGPPDAPQPRPFVPQRNAAAPQEASGDVLRAFCEGAGLDPALAEEVDPVALARVLGEVSQVSSALIMGMLRERAHVKQFTRSGERTMRAATGNNPLKFLPDVGDAVSALYLQPRDGFQSGAEGVGGALRDIQRHQQAIFAALQPALAAVLQGLSPEEVEDGLQGGLLSGARKGRAWDEYVARWDRRATSGENGMLDAFLEAFAQAYAKAHGDNG